MTSEPEYMPFAEALSEALRIIESWQMGETFYQGRHLQASNDDEREQLNADPYIWEQAIESLHVAANRLKYQDEVAAQIEAWALGNGGRNHD